MTGSTGFVGKKLCERLVATGHIVIPFSLRHPDTNFLSGIEAVIHLAGEPIAEGRWTVEKKKRIYDSRVKGTKILFDLIDTLGSAKPSVIISASAIGFYGDRGDEILNEESVPGNGFLAKVCKDWERETIGHQLSSVRQVAVRFGVVLGQGGALEKMILPFKHGVGGAVGEGNQWMSWIHIADLISMIEFVLNSNSVFGIVNAVSPHPETNLRFSEILAQVLGTKSRLKVPAIALKLLLGEKAELVLASQRVLPVRMIKYGFKFQYPLLKEALEKIFNE